MICFCQPSCVEIELNAVKLPWVFVGARKMPRLIGDTHDPCTQRFEHHVPCHNPALRETAPFRYQPFFVGRWLLAEPPEIRLQWFAFVSLLQ